MVLSPQRGRILIAICNKYVARGSGSFKCHWEMIFQLLEALWTHAMLGGDGRLYRNDVFICANHGVEGVFPRECRMASGMMDFSNCNPTCVLHNSLVFRVNR